MTSANITRSGGSWAAYGAAAWSFIFAVLHSVWAAGWYPGLPAAQARKAFQSAGFLIYDVAVAVLCALGVVVAMALARRETLGRTNRLIGMLASSGVAVLALRAGGGLVQILYLVATGRYVPDPMHLYELWFCLGATLFAVSTWRFWRARSSGSARPAG
jgi:H+/gluconate symporter-like permease